MRINQLWTHCLPGVKKKPSIKFNTVKGKTLAIDISGWLHQLCSSTNALLLTCAPKHPPNDVIATLKLWHQILTKHCIIPCYVFDGCRHPMKSKTNEDRKKESAEANEKSLLFCNHGRNPFAQLTEKRSCFSNE